MPPSGAFNGSATDKAWLLTLFDRHDLNRDGRLTLGELIRLAKWVDGALTTQQCEEAFDLMDPDQRGSIDFEAFFRWWTRRPPR